MESAPYCSRRADTLEWWLMCGDWAPGDWPARACWAGLGGPERLNLQKVGRHSSPYETSHTGTYIYVCIVYNVFIYIYIYGGMFFSKQLGEKPCSSLFSWQLNFCCQRLGLTARETFWSWVLISFFTHNWCIITRLVGIYLEILPNKKVYIGRMCNTEMQNY